MPFLAQHFSLHSAEVGYGKRRENGSRAEAL